MKKLLLSFFALFLFSNTICLAQQEGGELIHNREEAQTLVANFRAAYPNTDFAELGGKLSLSALETLVAQMKANGSKSISYRFGRTAGDNTGRNTVLFFNDGYNVDQLNQVAKYKSVGLCPTDCNPDLDAYLTR